jgi:hypothetical protein
MWPRRRSTGALGSVRAVASFSADDISGPNQLTGTASYYFTVALPGGGEGHAVVGVGDVGPGADEQTRRERVAAALNQQAEGQGEGAVVEALASADGLTISLTGF